MKSREGTIKVKRRAREVSLDVMAANILGIGIGGSLVLGLNNGKHTIMGIPESNLFPSFNVVRTKGNYYVFVSTQLVNYFISIFDFNKKYDFDISISRKKNEDGSHNIKLK